MEQTEIQTVLVAGLGLIGGSMAKAVKENIGCRVLGWNRTRAVAEKALADGAVDAIAEDADFVQLSTLRRHITSLGAALFFVREFVTGV